MIKYNFPQYIKSIMDAVDNPIALLKPHNSEANRHPLWIVNYELKTKPKPAKWSGRGYKRKRRK